jgi:hypothetical protein
VRMEFKKYKHFSNEIEKTLIESKIYETLTSYPKGLDDLKMNGT